MNTTFTHKGKVYTIPENPTTRYFRKYLKPLREVMSNPILQEALRLAEVQKASVVETTFLILAFVMENEPITNRVISETFRDDADQPLPLSEVDNLDPELSNYALNFFLISMKPVFGNIQTSMQTQVIVS